MDNQTTSGYNRSGYSDHLRKKPIGSHPRYVSEANHIDSIVQLDSDNSSYQTFAPGTSLMFPVNDSLSCGSLPRRGRENTKYQMPSFSRALHKQRQHSNAVFQRNPERYERWQEGVDLVMKSIYLVIDKTGGFAGWISNAQCKLQIIITILCSIQYQVFINSFWKQRFDLRNIFIAHLVLFLQTYFRSKPRPNLFQLYKTCLKLIYNSLQDQ